MDLKTVMINMGISALFIFGIFSFIITVQTNNSVSIPITNNSFINETYGDLSSEISSSSTKSETYKDTFGTTTPTQQYGEIEINSIVSPTGTIRSMTLGFLNILIKMPMVILGVSPVVASMITIIIVLILIIGTWAVWKGAVS